MLDPLRQVVRLQDVHQSDLGGRGALELALRGSTTPHRTRAGVPDAYLNQPHNAVSVVKLLVPLNAATPHAAQQAGITRRVRRSRADSSGAVVEQRRRGEGGPGLHVAHLSHHNRRTQASRLVIDVRLVGKIFGRVPTVSNASTRVEG